MQRELRAVALIAAAVLMVSAAAGAVWGWLAPTEQFRVVGDDSIPLTGENLHPFDALGIFVAVAVVVAAVTVIAAWRVRFTRGPALAGGLLIASGLGALVMSQVGTWVSAARIPDVVAGTVIEPAQTVTAAALLVQPLVAALLLVFFAGLAQSEDLGSGAVGLVGDRFPTAYYRYYQEFPIVEGRPDVTAR